MFEKDYKINLKNLDEKFNNYSQNNSAVYTPFEEYDAVFHASMNFGSFEIHFYFGDNLTWGYSFMEDCDNENLLAGLLTRFKFPFSKTYFSPYDIHNAIDDNDFKTLDFHCLINEDMLSSAADTILNFITKNFYSISRINENPDLKNSLENSYKSDMAIVSKKISEEKLSNKFEKYSEKHEMNMYFHHLFDTEIADFAVNGSKKRLEKFFAKQNAKNRLSAFEKRYCDYLMEHDFPKPSNDTLNHTKQIRSHNKKSGIYNSVYCIISLILSLIFTVLTEHITDISVFENYTVIYRKESTVFLFVSCFIAFALPVRIIIKKLFFNKSDVGNDLWDMNNKKSNLIAVLIAVVLLVGCGVYSFYSSQRVVAVSENDVFYKTSLFGGEIQNPDEKLEFFLIEGLIDHSVEGEETYSSNPEDKELYIVENGDYENYIYSDTYAEDIDKVLKNLKSNGFKVKAFHDQDAFFNAYNLNN